MTTTSLPAAAVPQRIIDAWRDYDADGFADVFTEDGVMALPGVFQKGREAIRGFMAAAFAGPYQGTQVVGAPIEVSVLDERTVLLVTEGGVRARTADTVPDERAVRALWVVREQDGEWRLAAYMNTPRNG